MPAVADELTDHGRGRLVFGAPLDRAGSLPRASLGVAFPRQEAEAAMPERRSGNGATVATIGTTDSDAAMMPDGGDPPPPASGHQGSGDGEPGAGLPGKPAAADTGVDGSIGKRADENSTIRLAQFQLPPAGTYEPRLGDPPRPITQYLELQYSYGSESDITYRQDADLNKGNGDNSLLLAPQVNGIIIYRPTEWLETALEMVFEDQIPVNEKQVIFLPNGETQFAQGDIWTLAVDQVYATFGRVKDPARLTVGRRNYEDDRHWLYDTSLDSAFLRLKEGAFQAELSVARKDLWDLDFMGQVPKGRIGRYILYTDYRGIEDVRLAAYAIRSHDRSGINGEGRPLHVGVRAYGQPSDEFSFWSDAALLRGKDALHQGFSGHAIDFGGTYRFMDLPYFPSVTLGYAFATGDGNPADGTNNEFRQTGLESNEWRFANVSKFKYYGETLDPQLSNLQIFTAGFGFRPAPTVFVDLVYHHYRLDAIADQIRNSALTAQMNQDDTQLSKDVGDAFDVVLGFRNLFGVRRLGLDLRAGWFFPGKAFRNDLSRDPDNPIFVGADKGFSVLAKFWY